MFDIFDILVPSLRLSPRLQVVAGETSSTKRLHIDGEDFAPVLRADVAYSNLLAWAGAPGREFWTVLTVQDTANKASAETASWNAFLDRLVLLLEAQQTSYITCESDCERCDLEELSLSAREVRELLDKHRSGDEDLSFRISCTPEIN